MLAPALYGGGGSAGIAAHLSIGAAGCGEGPLVAVLGGLAPLGRPQSQPQWPDFRGLPIMRRSTPWGVHCKEKGMQGIIRAGVLVLAALGAQSASAACYYVYSGSHQLLYRSVVSPVDLAQPLSASVPALGPGLALVFTQSDSGCEGTLDMLQAYRSSKAASKAATKVPTQGARR